MSPEFDPVISEAGATTVSQEVALAREWSAAVLAEASSGAAPSAQGVLQVLRLADILEMLLKVSQKRASEREALAKALRVIADHPDANRKPSASDLYDVGRVDGHRTAALTARHALTELVS